MASSSLHQRITKNVKNWLTNPRNIIAFFGAATRRLLAVSRAMLISVHGTGRDADDRQGYERRQLCAAAAVFPFQEAIITPAVAAFLRRDSSRATSDKWFIQLENRSLI